MVNGAWKRKVVLEASQLFRVQNKWISFRIIFDTWLLA
jgi:hypothetical protein